MINHSKSTYMFWWKILIRHVFRLFTFLKLTVEHQSVQCGMLKKSLEIPKGQLESVYRRRADNTMGYHNILQCE